MRLNRRTGLFLAVLALPILLGALRLLPRRAANDATAQAPQPAPFHLQSTAPSPAPVIARTTTTPSAVPSSTAFPYRLSNTSLSVRELIGRDSALLLNNAFLDTTAGIRLDIPTPLRASSPSGSYIVQARGPVDGRFHALLQQAGAAEVAYVPNNAFLVRGPDDAILALRSDPTVQAILPYEPYFKIETGLLAGILNPAARPDGDIQLRVVFFADAAGQGAQALSQAGFRFIDEERTPFGPMAVVEGPANRITELAALAPVQLIERQRERVLANDLTRVRLGIATDAETNGNYLGLTGKGVLVNVNDTGIDASHPDLKGRVVSGETNNLPVSDTIGHGTHVAGIIAGSGTNSSTLTNIQGSVAKAGFRGKAPAARLFALYFDSQVGPAIRDSFLVESAARTNALISNNSWVYRNANDYTTAAAFYDSAVRDALPGKPGSQPLALVFAAGNEGFANANGVGGNPNSIQAPATAKNVITVGATETFRQLTNTMVFTNGSGTNIVVSTNQVFFDGSDSENEVADYSSRGNVGIGTEGEFGRFKPDVVAPGSQIISLRASGWSVSTNAFNYEAEKSLQDSVKPFYRFDSGTSMAAPAIVGLLALMQEFFEQQLAVTNSPAMMKALLINGSRTLGKLYSFNPHAALNHQGWGQPSLTNIVPLFYKQYAGRKPSTPSPDGLVGEPATHDVPHVFIDQGTESLAASDSTATNSLRGHALATGQTESWNLSVTPEGSVLPLRLTLVWTDPPGNPAAAVKLVNDLDLVVSNTVTHEVFYGNDIPEDSDFNHAAGEDAKDHADHINNVENIFLPGPLSSNYVVSVVARRVNVNAVTANTNAIVQDFALVMSIGDGDLTNAFRLSRAVATLNPEGTNRTLVNITNGVALLNQRVGANNPLTNGTVGDLSQWNFYVFTNAFVTNTQNSITNGTNVAFITFYPPNLSKPRNVDADIDLYVSTNPALTNLDAAVLAASSKSTNRGGTQVVYFTNSNIGTVYYVGVKAEDQQAAEFGLFGISSDKPFTSLDDKGRFVLTGFPANVFIPDGSPEKPGAALMFAIGTAPVIIRNATAENFLQHESIGDLVGNLSHNGRFVVLNNHYVNPDPAITNHFFLYDDSHSGRSMAASRTSDGPGSLNDFIGEDGSGVWMFTEIDNAPSHTGRDVSFTIRLEKAPRPGEEISGEILPNRWEYFFVDVPPEGELLTVAIAQMDAPINVYARYHYFPTTTEYDKVAYLTPPAGTFTLGLNDAPPLRPGRYLIGLFNPNAIVVHYRALIGIKTNPKAALTAYYASTNTPSPILDQAVTLSRIQVDDTRQIVEARVGVRIDHPRVADLVLHLISPSGARVLLSENRGGLEPNGFGSGESTNLVYAGFSEDTNLVVGPIKSVTPPYTTTPTLTTNALSGFEGVENRSYSVGESVDGWTVTQLYQLTNGAPVGASSGLPTVLRDNALAHEGTNLLSLGRGRISRPIPTRPGQSYTLRFWSRAATDAAPVVNSQVVLDGLLVGFISGSNQWQQSTFSFIAAGNATQLELQPALNSIGMLFDQFDLIETSGAIYYSPEESLGAFKGEIATGSWALEVEDTRSGPVGGLAPRLVSWQLQFILTRPGPNVVVLTNGIPYFSSVLTNDIRYFAVDVPREGISATNLISAEGDLVLLYGATGLPTGSLPGDVVVDDSFSGLEFLLLSTNQPPALVPGQRYYLGVANADTTASNRFVIEADLNLGDSLVIQPPLLTNGVAITNTIQVTNLIEYYRFVVSPNAYNVNFELTPVNGDVNLLVRKARPINDPLPTTEIFDYFSAEPGTGLDQIIVVTNSTPVALTPGTWYLGVYNAETNKPVTYTLRATEALSPFTVTWLTNEVVLDASIRPAAVLSNFFAFTVPDPADDLSVRFDVFNLTASATLETDVNTLFDAGASRWRVASGPNGTARFMATQDALLDIRGDWYAALNPAVTNGTNLNFSIRAVLLTNSAPPVIALTDGVTVTNLHWGVGGHPEIEYYRFTTATNVKSFDVVLTPIFGDVDLVLAKGQALPATNRSDLASITTGNGVERIRLVIGSGPITLEGGDWTIGVINREAYAAQYAIQASQTVSGQILSPAPGKAVSGVSLPGVPDWYRVAVATNHESAVFQLTSASSKGQLKLLIRKGLPVPDPATATSISQSAPGGLELIALDLNSKPVPLSAGDWYVTVQNSGTNLLDYQFTYTLSGTTNGAPASGVKLTATLDPTGTQFCLSWPTTPLKTYGVEGKPTLTAVSWTRLKDLPAGVASSLSYCVPLTPTNRFFRVIELP